MPAIVMNVIVFFDEPPPHNATTYHRVYNAQSLINNLVARGRRVKYGNMYNAKGLKGANYLGRVYPGST